MANKPAFKNGVPLFKNGVLAFGDTACNCGCGCTCADLSGFGSCAICATGCTPRVAELVLSGIVTNCCNLAGGISMDGNGATLSGTFTATQNGLLSNCAWDYDENPGSTFNFRRWSTAACAGTVTNHLRWIARAQPVAGGVQADVIVVVPVGAGTVNVSVFSGLVAAASPCAGTHVVTNGGTSCGSGGTITVTFCP